MKLNKFIKNYCVDCPVFFEYEFPWEIVNDAEEIVKRMISNLSKEEYIIDRGIAIHKTAKVEKGAVLKGSVVIGKNCFVGSGAYLRGGVWLEEGVVIGPGSEIKSSFIFKKSRIAHFNYIGNSMIGEDVNFEAGSITANHFNERREGERKIEVVFDGKIIDTGVEKFGALVGDGSRIGANAVLSPGSILPPGKIIGRLEHYDQFKLFKIKGN